ncbi:hypothetical protein, partial [Coleofasciculus sp.]|uniref:hypothetical protein n=1 Tax=Coleofasciculus sp. TaxID=3100458 RepID=UPI0039F7A9FF
MIIGKKPTGYNPHLKRDLIISNFPFGTTAPFDPKYNPIVSNLHNYFWAKSWDALRNGGIIAAI